MGAYLISAKSVVAVCFLPKPFPTKADRESLFQSNISINKVLEPVKDSYSIYCLQPKFSWNILSEMSLLPILKPRIKKEKRERNPQSGGARSPRGIIMHKDKRTSTTRFSVFKTFLFT